MARLRRRRRRRRRRTTTTRVDNDDGRRRWTTTTDDDDEDDGRLRQRRRGRQRRRRSTTTTLTTTVEDDDEAQKDDDDFPPARRQHRQAVSRNASPAPSPTLRNERGHRQRQVCTRERHVCRDGKRQVCTGWTTSSCGPCECPHDNNSACECQRFGTNVHLCGPPPLHPPALSCGHSQETQEAPDDAPTGRAPEAASTRRMLRRCGEAAVCLQILL